MEMRLQTIIHFRNVIKLFCLGAALLSTCATYAADFDSKKTTSYSLSVGSNKTYSKNDANRSLEGTGLTGTVIDGGDHWIIDITGGSLNGNIRTQSGVEIRLNGNSIGLSNTKGGSAILGEGGVRITGPGVLHIDQWAKYSAIYSYRVVTFFGGAVVGINNLSDGNSVVGQGIRIIGSAVHVNAANGSAFYTKKEGFSISGSIVSAISTKNCVRLEEFGPLSIFGSSVHFISTSPDGAAVLSGTDIVAGGEWISVSSSVFCAAGGKHGIQFHDRGALYMDNVIGTVVGRKCGVSSAKTFMVSGGATKLTIAGNVKYEHSAGDTDAVSLLEDDYSSGAAIFLYGSSSYFQLEAGSMKLFAPGNVGLSVATNVVAGGSLSVESKPTYGDFQTLFTASGIISAAETVAGVLAFGSDILFADIDLTQALSSICTAADAIFGANPAKATRGLSQRAMVVLGGEVSVSASGVGIAIGKYEYAYGLYRNAFYCQDSGKVEIEAGGIGLADIGALDGKTSVEESRSLIWISGGRLSAKGGLDGILTCGGLLMEGGTLETAATGGHEAGTISAKPGLRGYAVSANNGFAIDGGSFVATAGALRKTPNTSSRHQWASVYPCDLDVSAANPFARVSISEMVPEWYGVNGLYPVDGKLRLWLPLGEASLKWNGKAYKANGDGEVIAGDNVFLADETILPPEVATLHVDASSGNDQNDGLSWETAKATIQNAIDVAVDGARIIVNDGVYEPISTVHSILYPNGKAVEIVSSNGAEKTFIDGSLTWGRNETNRVAFLGARDAYTDAPLGRQAVLDGFTIRKGRSSYGTSRVGAGAFGGTLRRCVITDNDSGRASGGGVANATLESCHVFGNRSGLNGGGAIGCDMFDCLIEDNVAEGNGGGTAAGRLERCVVRNNTAGQYGGGHQGGDAGDCLFVGNEATLGGGGVAGANLSRCTVVNNRTGGVGGGAIGAVLHGSIIWDNTAGEGDDNCSTSHGFYNDTAPRLPGTGNISSNPMFSNAPAEDYRLTVYSPCIDAGFGPTDTERKDLAGERRWQGVGIDMGAYEFENSFTPIFIAGDLWVDAQNGSDTKSGTSRDEALATIGAAIEKAADGATINVLPGTYAPFTLDGRTLTIRSTDNAKTTIINGAGMAQCVWIGADSQSVLEGLTLCNGYTPMDGGGVWGGTLRNCIVRDNTAGELGGGAVMARLDHCLVKGNLAQSGSGGGTFYCDLSNCLVYRNAAVSGGGVWSGGHCVVNCTITDNTASSIGGGVMSAGFVTNSIVWGNSAPSHSDTYGCDTWHICSSDDAPERGCITSDPLFIDAANEDYRLAVGSPCIDAGADNGIGGAGTDLDGNPRVRGDRIDLGCYESTWNDYISPIGEDIYAFVTRLYSLCLNREPDQGGLEDWALQLADGRNDGANVAFGFFMSLEMANRNLSNEDFVEVLYNVMMNRDSDAGGKAYWVDALNNGVSRAGALRGFAESAEFTHICGSYGITRGSLNRANLEARDLNFGVTMFVARCYTKALGRAYDVDGLNYWCAQINSSPNPKAMAIYVSTTGFFDSQEFQLRRLGNGAFVDVLYETFLGRAADAGGRADWVSQLNAGADRHAVMAGFYNSAEFNAIMTSYGL